MTYPSSFFPLFFTVNCMCFKCVFAGVHWPLHTGGELLNSSPLHPGQISLASALNRRSLGLLELNHNYLPSSDGGESVHCVIPISPLDMKNASRIQKGGTLCWSHGFDWRGRIWDGATVVLELLSLLFLSPLYLFIPLSHPHTLPFSFYTSPSHSSLFLSPSIPPASLPPSASLFPAALSEYNCGYCAVASKKSSVQG